MSETKQPLEIENIQQLMTRINEISNKYEEISKVSGDNFNVFRVIELTSDEVRLHSKFLAELLNPKGSHGQGSKFLDLFIQQFDIKNVDPETSKVDVEKYIGNKTDTEGGRIDILIEDSNQNAIIIENKIYASDQENQLVRYSNYKTNSKIIFYLNLDGSDPSEYSCHGLKIDEDFKVISYKDDILTWLENCKKESVSLPLLREGITHYMNLIKHLTGQSNNTTMDKEIIDLLATPQNIEIAIKIANSTIGAKSKIQWEFWKQLREEFDKQRITLLDGTSGKSVVSEEKVQDYYNNKNNNKLYGLWTQVLVINDTIIYYKIEIYHNIYCGFTAEKNKNFNISNLPECEEIRHIIKEIDDNYQTKPLWLGQKYVTPKLNFKEFNTQDVFNLADRNNLEQVVKDIVQKSINDIKLFNKNYQKSVSN
ncbi:MAG TPA: PD-(D/E)XK nuclease family protein [Paludibacteraceae bacterium]|nr:PD-(D/E)XK nuclease family protein [Paludibacteraceae bacterium]HOS37556.1 PD-(D/E)XK nuclease family protein [Paludibacteraceae bacterium]HPK20235.1 PD-(D/E)XK nuclease family protein [Paludibacteraceae bacterium]